MDSLRRGFYLSLCIIGLACVSHPVYAGQAEDIKKIEQLLYQKQGEKAYQYAHSLLSQYEGIPEFDYVYGMAAQAAQQYHQAIFAFERVTAHYPNSHQTRYALAISYFTIGNLQAAKEEFDQLVKHERLGNYPKITDYLAAIAKKSNQQQGSFEHSVQFGLGIDSNANSGVDDEFIDIPQLGEVKLFDTSQETDDYFIQSQWKSSYIKPIHNNSSVYAVAQLRHADYQQHSSLTRLYGDLLSGWQIRTGEVQHHISGFFRPVWLGDSKYLNYYGLSGESSYDLDKWQRLGVSVSLAQQNYQQDELDKSQIIGSLWYDKRVRKYRHRWKLAVGWEHTDDAQFDYLSRNFFGISYQVSMRISSDSAIDAAIDYIDSSYRGVQPLFGQTREDKMWKLTLNYQYQLSKNLSWLNKANYLDHDSNLSLYQYDRLVVWSAVRYRF